MILRASKIQCNRLKIEIYGASYPIIYCSLEGINTIFIVFKTTKNLPKKAIKNGT